MTPLYLITDRRLLGTDPGARDELVRLIAAAAEAGIGMVQIREKDLTARDLHELAERAVQALEGSATRLLVNERADVASASGAAGVHLPSRSLPVAAVRRAFGDAFLIGVSTHSGAEVGSAASDRADFVVCGPVFDTPSKSGLGEPLGPNRLAAISRTARLPVFALGGITPQSAALVRSKAACGLAGIRLFHDAWNASGLEGLRTLVRTLSQEPTS